MAAITTSTVGLSRDVERCYPRGMRMVVARNRRAGPALAKPANISALPARRARPRLSAAGPTPSVRVTAHVNRALALAGVEDLLKDYKDGDVLYSFTDKDQPMWLEVQVAAGVAGPLYATSGGYELRLNQAGGNLEAELLAPVGLPDQFYSRLLDTLDKEAVDAVKEILKVKDLPKGSKVSLKEASFKYSYQQLYDDVKENASQWVDGVGEVEATLLDQGVVEAVGQAGEILSLLQGKRGVVLVQLWTVKDKEVSGAVYNPLAIRAFRQAMRDPEVDIKLSLATTPDGDPLGLTAVFAAKKAPFDAWGAHLASMGVQSALVADSAQHKVMIGQMLGYSEPNIMHHLESRNQEWSTDMQLTHDKYMAEISAASPSLPWRDPMKTLPSATGVVTSTKVPSQSGFGVAKKNPSSGRKKSSSGRKKR